MNGMIDPSGRKTPDFVDVVSDTVGTWIKENKKFNNPSTFVVMVAQEHDGRASYWGVIDVILTPEEDLYVEMEKRFYCALRTIGQDQVAGIGILDIRAVMDRIELPIPPKA